MTTFGSTTNQFTTTINIGSSGSEFLDSMNGYFCGYFVCNAATADANRILRRWLDNGGIHSLIHKVVIRLRNGTRIEELDEYSKLYNIMRAYTMSKEQIDSVQGFECGDSTTHHPYLQNYVSEEAKLGDDDDYVALDAHTAIVPARQEICDGNDNMFSFKLMSDFFTHIKYLPLPMLQQLQIEITWHKPRLSITANKYADNNTLDALRQLTNNDTVAYDIKDFHYVANLIEPSEPVLEKFMRAWSTSGISLPFISHRRFSQNLNTGAAPISYEFQASFNSARYVLATFHENIATQDTLDALGYPCQSTFQKSGLAQYTFKSGGLVFPDHAPVDTSTRFASEAFTQIMIALNQHQNTLLNTSINLRDLDATAQNHYNISAGNGGRRVDGPTKFIFGADLTRYDDYTGLNTTGNNLRVEMVFNSASDGAGNRPANRNLLAFIGYDAVLTLSKEYGSLVRY
jgi:hypothetical protein